MTVRQEARVFKNIAATPADFGLTGGLYQINVVATWGGGSVILKQLAPDGTTYLSVSGSFTANGGTTLYLPPGVYQLTIATATAVYASVSRIQD